MEGGWVQSTEPALAGSSATHDSSATPHTTLVLLDDACAVASLLPRRCCARGVTGRCRAVMCWGGLGCLQEVAGQRRQPGPARQQQVYNSVVIYHCVLQKPSRPIVAVLLRWQLHGNCV
jgi:hypothetical protein